MRIRLNETATSAVHEFASDGETLQFDCSRTASYRAERRAFLHDEQHDSFPAYRLPIDSANVVDSLAVCERSAWQLARYAVVGARYQLGNERFGTAEVSRSTASLVRLKALAVTETNGRIPLNEDETFAQAPEPTVGVMSAQKLEPKKTAVLNDSLKVIGSKRLQHLTVLAIDIGWFPVRTDRPPVSSVAASPTASRVLRMCYPQKNSRTPRLATNS